MPPCVLGVTKTITLDSYLANDFPPLRVSADVRKVLGAVTEEILKFGNFQIVVQLISVLIGLCISCTTTRNLRISSVPDWEREGNLEFHLICEMTEAGAPQPVRGGGGEGAAGRGRGVPARGAEVGARVGVRRAPLGDRAEEDQARQGGRRPQRRSRKGTQMMM